ncbi:unnamed protein product [Fraxinus pennsylvanica]|uniref:Metallothionein-like protein n=1 Tax=Fraxinus pennsylvanica TaxID=56036 RepID=A0AAD1Z0F9_9LAMI|nr:unnamed protein product [Fraxinus pennsylvanica]
MSSGCGCGSSCSCGSNCSCGKMYPDVEKSTTVTIIEGVAPMKMYSEGSEKSFSAEGAAGYLLLHYAISSFNPAMEIETRSEDNSGSSNPFNLGGEKSEVSRAHRS